jgi:restriction endonuclease S subunit
VVEIEDLKNLIQEDLIQEIQIEALEEEEVALMNQTEDRGDLVLENRTEEVIIKGLVPENLKTIQVLGDQNHLMQIASLDLGEVEENNIC